MAQKPTSTGLINLADWLRANQRGADSLGRSIAAAASADVDSAQRGISEVGSAFDNAASQQAASLSMPTAPDINSFGTAQDRDWVGYNNARKEYEQRLKDISAATYKGPQQLDEMPDFAAAERRASQATSRAAGLGTDAGRAAQLGQMYGRPDYNSSLKAADSFLAGAGAGGQAAIKGAMSKGSSLSNFLADARSKAGASARAGEQAVAARAKEAQAELDRLNAPAPTPEPIPEVPEPTRPPYKEDQLENNRRRRRGEDYYGNDTTYP